jgi:hypothetical protein
MIWKSKGYKNNNVVYLFKKYEMALSLPPPLFLGRFGLWCLSNATFNNISVLSWLLVLLVEENGVPRENHRHVASH